MKEKVAVIVPVLNRKELLVRCLDSIAAQTWRPLEIIVVDNGSTDGSASAASEWGNAHTSTGLEVKVLHEPAPGACNARNTGLRNATSPFTCFFDSDDTMRPDLISKGMEALASHTGVDVACWRCAIHLLDGSTKVPAFNPGNPLEDHLVNALLRTQGYLARTDLFRASGGWDSSLPAWNDWELGARILLNGACVTAIDSVLADIFAQKESITGTAFSAKAGNWEKSIGTVRKDTLLSPKDSKEKNHILRILAYRAIILASHYRRERRPDLSKNLREKALHGKDADGLPLLNSARRMLLTLAYHYTRFGGRGAWRLVRNFM